MELGSLVLRLVKYLKAFLKRENGMERAPSFMPMGISMLVYGRTTKGLELALQLMRTV